MQAIATDQVVARGERFSASILSVKNLYRYIWNHLECTDTEDPEILLETVASIILNLSRYPSRGAAYDNFMRETECVWGKKIHEDLLCTALCSLVRLYSLDPEEKVFYLHDSHPPIMGFRALWTKQFGITLYLKDRSLSLCAETHDRNLHKAHPDFLSLGELYGERGSGVFLRKMSVICKEPGVDAKVDKKSAFEILRDVNFSTQNLFCSNRTLGMRRCVCKCEEDESFLSRCEMLQGLPSDILHKIVDLAFPRYVPRDTPTSKFFWDSGIDPNKLCSFFRD